MNIADVAIHRPVFTSMVAIGLMVLGAVSFLNLGVDLFPSVNFPIMTIAVPYPGASPEEVEAQVTKPLEDAISSTTGLDRIRSYSREGVSMIIPQFTLETDIKSAATDVREKIAKVKASLPKDTLDPVISRVDPSASPVLIYTISGNRTSLQIRNIAEDKIKASLESVDGVGSINIIGGLKREVKVKLSLQKIQAINISPLQVAQILASENIDVPSGRFTQNEQEVSIRAVGQFSQVADIGEILIPAPNGSSVKLKELAVIEDGTEEARVRTRVNGKTAVAIEVIKASGTNSIEVADKVKKRMDQLIKQLPSDVNITQIIDTTEFIRENTHELNISIIYGGAMAILIIFLFMLDWRSTLISALALPTSVITTFFLMAQMGFTLNMMSLLGLSLAIGLLIDDAVVVRENIFRHMEMGEDPVTAASKGTQEIALAVMATTFTIVAVFVPVAFTKGMVGQFFREFGLTVAGSVLISLFIAFTVDPMLSARLVKPIDPNAHENDRKHFLKGPILKFYDGLDSMYKDMLSWSLNHRIFVMFVATLMLFGSFYLTKYMGTDFFAKQDRGQFTIQMKMPAGTAVDKMDRIVQKAEDIISNNNLVKTQYTTIGINYDVTQASIRVLIEPKANRPNISYTSVMEDLRKNLSSIPDLKVTMMEPQIIEGMLDYPIAINIRGENMDKLLELSEKVKSIVKKTPGTADVDSSYSPGKPEYHIEIDRTKAAALGVNMAQLGLTLRAAIEGDTSTRLRDGLKEYDIRVQLRDEDKNQKNLLESYIVPTRTGRLVYLREVANIVPKTGPGVIERETRQRQITITGNTVGRSLGEIVADIRKASTDIEFPDGYSMKFSGEAERMEDSQQSLGIAFLLGIIFIYLVLASQFESFIHPFTIMFSLPLAIVGALLSLFLTGYSLGLNVFIGIILLMGLVTKNAILLVDFTIQIQEHRGLGVKDALLIAGPTRLRPILMTSMAMVLGMLPTAMATSQGSEFRAPMAIAVIGGVIVSTILTLVIVPIVYSWMDKLTTHGKSTPNSNNTNLPARITTDVSKDLPTELQKEDSYEPNGEIPKSILESQNMLNLDNLMNEPNRIKTK